MKLNMCLHEMVILLFVLSMMLLLIVVTEGPPIGPAFGIGWIVLLVLSRLEKKRDTVKSEITMEGVTVKTKITRIGTIAEDGTIVDWTFDGAGLGPRTVGIYPRKGLTGGYTVKELQEISSLNQKLEQLTKGGA